MAGFGGETVGLITYMRTDGIDMAPEAVMAARDEIKRWGKAHNGDFVGVHYLVRSKVIAMLISVAAFTLAA